MSEAFEAPAGAGLTAGQYKDMVLKAGQEPEAFWLEQARKLVWHVPPQQASRSDFTGDVRVDWFSDGSLNVSEN